MRHRTRCRTAVLLLSLLVAPAARAGWRLAPFASDESGTRAVATARDGRIAAGDGRGVWVTDAAGAARRLDLAGASRDLAFAPDGALWIASDAGLFQWTQGRLLSRAPAPGDLASDVARVAVEGTAVAVATAAGIFFAADGVRFERVDAALGEAAATGLALEPGADGLAIWIASERGLHRALAAPGARAERVVLDPDLRPALDVDARDGRVVVLGAGWLAERGADEAFVVQRTALPPGATPVRVAAGASGIWIATDRGVVSARSVAAGFERTDDPAGSALAWDVAVAGERVLAATARGVLVGDANPGSARAAGDALAPSCDPPVREVQRAALAHLRLAGDPAAAMRRGVRMRGLLPIVTLEAARGRDEDDGAFDDEAYVSGGYRRLRDRDHVRRREDEFALRLSWDLGDAAFHPEQIDVSTEARRLVELRDDVLDELNQLYFDRQRALAAAADPASPDAARERIRAAELAAGLDGWTDGWFARAAACPAPNASPPR